MTKETAKEAAVAAEVLLFDDWFDAIEDGVRARVRGFIETMLEEELAGALSASALWPAARRSRANAGGGRCPARPSHARADRDIREAREIRARAR